MKAPYKRIHVIINPAVGENEPISSFSYETLQLVTQDRWWAAGLNVLGDIGLGLLGVFLGIVLGRWLQGTGVG